MGHWRLPLVGLALGTALGLRARRGSRTTLRGRVALVTGGSRGIGAAIARRLAQDGAKVAVNYSSSKQAAEAVVRTIKEDGGEAVLAPGDVSAKDGPAKIAAAAHDAFGRIDILVNNAGNARSASFERTDAELWSEMLAINLTGSFLVTRAVASEMLARRAGRIVNIASTAGLSGYAYVSAYVAAKHGLVGLTRELALEFARKGVTVNAVCPGYTDTPMLDAAIAGIAAKTGRGEEDARATLAAANPSGRLVTPEEVADAVLWLASPGAASINGQAIVVAGGEVMVG
jgi:NAD(P)-dependent dehydrogenase (short-subunit alcohol dehydrogenase family)